MTVYCVEDDSGIRELILCALGSGGYEAEGFADARTLYAALQQRQPDLLLLDIMLPDEDGISLLRQLQKNPRTAQIPVIMLSAKSGELDKVTALENGADDYITKPFGVMELLSRIKAVLRRSGEHGDQRLCAEGLCADLDKRTVSFEQTPVELTYKEFELLCCLLRNRGTALSRDLLLERVWGFTYEGETRTVDAHIKTLRQKLDAAGCHDRIQTVRGYGYRLQ